MGRNNIGRSRTAFSFAMACVAVIAVSGCSQEDVQATSHRPITGSQHVIGGDGEPYACPTPAMTFTRNVNQQARAGDTVVRVEFAGKTVTVSHKGSGLTMQAIVIGDDTGGYVGTDLTEVEKSSNPLVFDASEFFTTKSTVDTMQLLSGAEVTQVTICT